jgi:abequosyltransferase
MNMPAQTLLTIAIPTWNRAFFLQLTLQQLIRQLPELSCKIEILVSDNASSDNTIEVVGSVLECGFPIRYIRNPQNLGSDQNIAQCFNQALGRYVLILGDDDLLIDGALKRLEQVLADHDYGAVAFRAYGYDNDFRAEHPGGVEHLYSLSASDFLAKLGIFSTLISANIICKDVLPGVDATTFCGSNLVQTELVYSAALQAPVNLYIDYYLVACKRNNTGGYSFSDVFVDNFGAILDKYQSIGLSLAAKMTIDKRMLLGFYPYYAWQNRLKNSLEIVNSYQQFHSRFSQYWQFYVFVAPILKWPKFAAISYGAITLTLGRIFTGDLRRGFCFVWNWICHKL